MTKYRDAKSTRKKNVGKTRAIAIRLFEMRLIRFVVRSSVTRQYEIFRAGRYGAVLKMSTLMPKSTPQRRIPRQQAARLRKICFRSRGTVCFPCASHEARCRNPGRMSTRLLSARFSAHADPDSVWTSSPRSSPPRAPSYLPSTPFRHPFHVDSLSRSRSIPTSRQVPRSRS